MKVWFGCTTSKWVQYRKYYFSIRDYIKELGCEISHDWIDWVDEKLDNEYKTRDINDIYEKVIKAIDNSDAIIIEYTVPNFSSSHQINYAILKKKPLLILRLKKDNPNSDNSYIDVLQSNNVKIKEYTLKSYKDIIKEFIGYTKVEQGQQRYNIILDKKQKQYLDWAAIKYNKSRSLIIRDLVDEKLEDDLDYKKYLNI